MKLAHYLILVSLALASCSEPLCGCSPFPNGVGYVRGQVVTDFGAPIPNADILASVVNREFACTPQLLNVLGHADSSGQYRLALAWAAPITACVFVGARMASGASTRDTVLGPFHLELRGGPPFDTLTVNLVIRR